MIKRQQRISLESLRLLDAIDRQGSFSNAAQELCVVTSSITHAIRNLEENLGLTLFDRSGQRARFTSKGRTLLESGRHLLARADAFDDEVQSIATGWEPRLTITVDQVVPMSPLMKQVEDFLEVAPQTILNIRREAAAGSWDSLASGRADLIVGAPVAVHFGEGFESALMFETSYVLAVSVKHPLALHQGSVSREQLALYRAIFVGDTSRAMPLLPYGLQDNRQRLSVPDHAAKLEAILMGLGCGFLNTHVATPLVRKGLIALLDVETPRPPSQGSLAWRSGETGRALKWWIERLTSKVFIDTLLNTSD
ncbi:LysR substrate-binding domain-containing protein [Limnohabitans sp. Rim8]|uniref:LysR substrate-binding domain-containing protein n=1 Tax=Limnohabitans sp. Rim8 TaxID=1100718 RepID=UPI00260DE532|nr:LysR substrate-binding domain-containing protein [Limnohabitans sp. Rim8]